MDASLKPILRSISLALRHELEGWRDEQNAWQPGDLERRLNELGVWSDRPSKPLDEMRHLSAEDRAARVVVDGYLQLRSEAGVGRASAFSEFVRESAYTWANRLLALRCMEARGIIDEVILQKAAYSGRSLVHQRFLRKNPEAATGEDDGLFAVLFAEFTDRSAELPALFDPHSAAVALRPSAAALKRCVALLSGTEVVRGQDPASDEVFTASDAFGWAYQYWNTEEKSRVFEAVRTKKGTKIEGADIIPATQLYTEPYMVKFLIQNSLGALWMSLNPESRLCEAWEYYVKDADRAPVSSLMANRSVREFTILDPALGSGHFHMEAFDLLFAMYQEEDPELSPREIAASILNNNLFGIDLDERAIQIAEAALWMKAKDVAPDLEASDLNSFHEHLVATNIRLPRGRNHLEAFLKEHPEDSPLRPALERVFQGLEHADELGSLLQIEEPVDHELRRLKQEADRTEVTPPVQGVMFEPVVVQSSLPLGLVGYDEWKAAALERLKSHFEQESEAADSVRSFFGISARKGLALFDLLARRYDVVAANPPYMGSKNMSQVMKNYAEIVYPTGKRDLYAAFILRCRELVGENGTVAMVTMHTWQALSSFESLRNSLLLTSSFSLLVNLARYAFSEADPPGFVVLLALQAAVPLPGHRITGFRQKQPNEPKVQAKKLRDSIARRGGAIIHHVRQQTVTQMPGSPLIYWLPKGLVTYLESGQRLDRFARVLSGMQTGNNLRLTRFAWECSDMQRWRRYAKGGGYRKWRGFENVRTDWRCDGALFRLCPSARRLGNDIIFRKALTYSYVCRGSLGVRFLTDSLHDNSSMLILPEDENLRPVLAGALNSRAISYLLRAISDGVKFQPGQLAIAPVPHSAINDDEIRSGAWLCEQLAAADVEDSVLEDYKLNSVFSVSSKLLKQLARWAVRHTVEGFLEARIQKHLNLASSDLEQVFNETGTPVGHQALIEDMTDWPLVEGADDPSVDAKLFVTQLPLINLSTQTKLRLRNAFEAGPSTGHEEAEDSNGDDSVEIEDDLQAIDDSSPIPPETFLEELSQLLGLHPLSVFWMLRDGIMTDGWRCPPEEKRLIEDRFTVLVLRMLGHRWPKQIEASESLPDWADLDGVILVSRGSSEPTLAQRIVERLSEEFGGTELTKIRAEFEAIVGMSLDAWLANAFFARHISQFKKRPVAWQLQSEPLNPRERRRSAAPREPIFACLLYYHRLDADLLPKLRSQYLGVLKIAFDTEHRTLESLKQPTPEQLARKAELDVLLEELNQFDAQLQVVVESGFGPSGLQPRLRQIAVDDSLLSMKSRWLARLSGLLQNGEPEGAGSSLQEWQQAASDLDHHEEFADWIANAVAHLPHHCATAGVKSLDVSEVPDDPTPATLAELICSKVEAMTEAALTGLCAEWRKQHEIYVIRPLKDFIATATTQLDQLAAELESMDRRDVVRVETITREQKRLKADVKLWKKEIKDKTDAVSALAVRIRHWTSPEPSTWESWLASTALFDEISSLDGRRPAPTTIREFVQQESLYAPDLNDGVRVNIAPLQRAGLLAAEVLAAKDLDKAIADRAEWRADERRWVREGKLPQPGWWKQQNEEVSS